LFINFGYGLIEILTNPFNNFAEKKRAIQLKKEWRGNKKTMTPHFV